MERSERSVFLDLVWQKVFFQLLLIIRAITCVGRIPDTTADGIVPLPVDGLERAEGRGMAGRPILGTARDPSSENTSKQFVVLRGSLCTDDLLELASETNDKWYTEDRILNLRHVEKLQQHDLQQLIEQLRERLGVSCE